MYLPAEFQASTRQLMGEPLYEQLVAGLQDEPTVSIHLNPFKTKGLRIDDDVTDGKVAWCDGGFYLNCRPHFTFDPFMHAGLYYVQEASSMFLYHVVSQLTTDKEPLTVLDLCAAPGGKSMIVRSALPEGSIVFSNEPLRQRANVLNENLLKFGHPDVFVTNNYPKDYARAQATFDIVVADVPCSGEGMFRKDEKAAAEWSTEKVAQCAKLQREIITDIWQCLKPGGYLIYSTCTFNRHENEDNINWIAENLGAMIVDIPVETGWNTTNALVPLYQKASVVRFIPGKSRGEGLFVALLRKSGKWTHTITKREDLKAIASKRLNLMSAGVLPATVKGKQMVPSHSEALSICLDRNKYPVAAVSYQQAISYLRKESLTLPPETPKGHILLTYNDVPIGFVKNIGQRANNLYPAEWKIKSSYIQEQRQILIPL